MSLLIERNVECVAWL